MTTGKLKMWNADRGFGFITDDSGRPDIFLHASALEAAGFRPDSIKRGDPLAFDVETSRGGRMKASNDRQVDGEKMSERLETLKKARDRMVADRDTHAKVLAAPFDRDNAERARIKFVEIQSLIDALDRAIHGEEDKPVN